MVFDLTLSNPVCMYECQLDFWQTTWPEANISKTQHLFEKPPSFC